MSLARAVAHAKLILLHFLQAPQARGVLRKSDFCETLWVFQGFAKVVALRLQRSHERCFVEVVCGRRPHTTSTKHRRESRGRSASGGEAVFRRWSMRSE